MSTRKVIRALNAANAASHQAYKERGMFILMAGLIIIFIGCVMIFIGCVIILWRICYQIINSNVVQVFLKNIMFSKKKSAIKTL